MEQEMCRLCLSKESLIPLFYDTVQSAKYVEDLALTTGLTITPDDGLPQQICPDCTDLVEKSLKLRNQSQLSQIKLEKLGFSRLKHENTPTIAEDILQEEINQAGNLKNDNDSFDFDGFNIEIEMDRVSQDGGDNSLENNQVVKQNDVKPVKKSRAEIRKLYMSYVDGDFDPNGPVKCKVCKQIVSKWACFINHAKKHLGVNVICEYCGKSFTSKHQLNRHCRSFHGMERDRKCKHCDYLALDKRQLMIHVRHEHTGVRPYVCDECSAAYFSRSCLLQHIESHRTTASVQCELCPAMLKSRRHLSKHKYAIHTDKLRNRRRQSRLAKKLDSGGPAQ